MQIFLICKLFAKKYYVYTVLANYQYLRTENMSECKNSEGLGFVCTEKGVYFSCLRCSRIFG